MRPAAVAAATASALFALPLLAAPALAQDAAAGKQDLQAIHDELRDNSPEAVVEKDSSTFRDWLDKGLQQSLELAPQVDTPNAYGYLLQGYSGGFRDSAINAQPNWAPPPRSFAVDWPGFSTSWRDGAYYVAYVKKGVRGTPPVGAKLLSCDGKPAEQVARARLDRYEGNLDLEADRVRTAPWLFWDRANPFIGSHPLSCEFQVGRGKRTVELAYTTSPESDREEAYVAAAPVSDGKLSVEQWGPGRIWINAHSLQDGAPLDTLMEQIDSQANAIQNASVVVIDLRGASHGTQAAAYRLANHVWGPDYVRMHWPPAKNVVFRVSQANRDYFAGIAAQLRADPKYHTDREIWDEAHTADAIAAAFDQAIAQHQTTFTFAPPPPPVEAAPSGAAPGAATAGAAAPGATTPATPATPATAVPAPAAAGATPPPPPPPATNPVKGRVFIVTDYACDSGCLQFMDVVSRLPNVTQAGNTTDADTIYVEPVTKIIGHARVTYPLRAWLDRPRPSGQPYTPAPALTWTGAYNDETGFKTWLDKAVAAAPAPAAPAAQ